MQTVRTVANKADRMCALVKRSMCPCGDEIGHSTAELILLAQEFSEVCQTYFLPMTEVIQTHSNLQSILFTVQWLDCSLPTGANLVRFPGGVARGFSHVGVMPDDADGRRVFSGISPFPPPLHSAAASHSPRFYFSGVCFLEVVVCPNTHISVNYYEPDVLLQLPREIKARAECVPLLLPASFPLIKGAKKKFPPRSEFSRLELRNPRLVRKGETTLGRAEANREDDVESCCGVGADGEPASYREGSATGSEASPRNLPISHGAIGWCVAGLGCRTFWSERAWLHIYAAANGKTTSAPVHTPLNTSSVGVCVRTHHRPIGPYHFGQPALYSVHYWPVINQWRAELIFIQSNALYRWSSTVGLTHLSVIFSRCWSDERRLVECGAGLHKCVVWHTRPRLLAAGGDFCTRLFRNELLQSRSRSGLVFKRVFRQVVYLRHDHIVVTGNNKGDTTKRKECAIATKRKALNLRLPAGILSFRRLNVEDEVDAWLLPTFLKACQSSTLRLILRFVQTMLNHVKKIIPKRRVAAFMRTPLNNI
ncbi:hypothetical protein PR048_007563 [Dryococelus australis]|uniref:Uncharacterized protein n=1 Tax=Dryococelus australis TaxID=614101 RepID=A0ABQ9HUK9_9NEOP|nr:hypothetical protein PR048_007563 [Dryococelus australis]